MGQIEPRRAQLSRSSTLEITNSAVFDSPAGCPDNDGGGGRAYEVGAEVEEEREGRVVWRERARWDRRRGRRVAVFLVIRAMAWFVLRNEEVVGSSPLILETVAP
ncbi:hypothetical protein Dsin_011594 [Dipteronia sinensis]|uniref:Uncharacterized protein n=1 Tax=Dipteronia sinensis TaxID=43782 RepID=A0AAE0AVZ0_9ROSI|nr:hypothetical protein Dsin_011594 [Dipteronia sinensis]